MVKSPEGEGADRCPDLLEDNVYAIRISFADSLYLTKFEYERAACRALSTILGLVWSFKPFPDNKNTDGLTLSTSHLCEIIVIFLLSCIVLKNKSGA